MANCKRCGIEYPNERCELGFDCCISCSPQFTYLAVEGGENKTGYGVTGMIRSDDSESVRRLNSTDGQTIIPRRNQHRRK